MNADLSAALTALDECDRLRDRLEAGCCDPERSPRMVALADVLSRVRVGLGALDHDSAPVLLGDLEEVGARLGGLQVACCTPKRMPLYADMLERLTTIQLTVSQALGTGH